MTRRDSTNSINNNTQQIPKLMRSSSMQKMEKIEKPINKNVLMLKGSASTNRLVPFRYLDR
jgi:hypothetical protein